LLRTGPSSLVLSASAAAFAAGCHDAPAAIVGVSPPRAPERSDRAVDAAVRESSPVAEDFRAKMIRIGDRFLSQGHAQRFEAVVWANAPAKKQWDAPDEMPVGAMLVEEAIVREADFDQAAGLLVMEKRDVGWRFVVVTAEGDVVSNARVAACETCHHEAKGEVFALTQEAGAARGAKETQPNR
jgi:hypothetical protein